MLLPNRHLARRVIAMFLRTNELSNAVQLAKDNMKGVREEKQKSLRQEKLNSQKALNEQKRHFENIVARHQIFVEQLLKDKSNLCEKVAAISRRIESQNQAWEHKLETEISRTKETVVASEKIRRERWTKENTKKIKELTVKGLEHEINKMTDKQSQEISELKRSHQEELLAKTEEARMKFEQMEKNVRESYAEDRESIIEKERNVIRERYERQLISDQNSFEEQKIRLMLEWNGERERLHHEIKEKEREFEGRRESLVRERNEMLDQLRNDHKDKVKALSEQHQAEIHAIRDQFEKDFSIWKCEYESAQKLREIERENLIRGECRKERDFQIDNIVTKIDSESQKSQYEYDMKLRRIKEKFEIDLKELEIAEARAREKYLETRHRLAETEALVQNMQSSIKQLEIELSHSKRMCNEFIMEKDKILDGAKKEIHQEVDTMKKEHGSEIQRIYSRYILDIFVVSLFEIFRSELSKSILEHIILKSK